jgi:mediator of RNA polymerase II transcription subunit 18
VNERSAVPEDLARLNNSDLYKYAYQYVLRGHRFIHGNIIVRLYRFYYSPKKASGLEKPIDDAPPSTMDDLSPIDLSGAWIVDATVRVEDSANAELTEQAKRELERFRGAMNGAVDFRAPDRLALDTRVRNV